MIKCPKCKKDVEKFEWITRGYVSGNVLIDGSGIPAYEANDIEKKLLITCPNCEQTLFDNQRDMFMFAKFGKMPKRDPEEDFVSMEELMGMTGRELFGDIFGR